ncbi:hypothetical protein FZEAL_5102 [Fusarium zealandicum]|uniref:MOSC domain-containing protein n=1 Tax=Fusarium zealandicum TaxID=1053134 RepID=A0A8H4XK44_9HYPO|nr:hypothetical protein FZEAL_5102 [Fusarium zealandicum]
MEAYLQQLAQWLQDSVKASPYTYSAAALTFLLGVHVVFAILIWTDNNAGVRSELKHLQRLGASSSNMTDQNDPRFDIPEDAASDGPIRIKALFIHPVKSCAPIELDRAQLTKTGFKYDRSFALATEVARTADSPAGVTWRFISQRTKPAMSQIRTELWLPHKDSDQQDPLVQAGGCMVLTFPDPDAPGYITRLSTLHHAKTPEISFIVPLEPTPALIHEFNIGTRPFAIHARSAKGLDLGPIPSVKAALPMLKRFLKVPESQNLTLLKCTPDTLVRTDKNLAPLDKIGTPAVHGFTDQQPININSLSSVHAVSSLLPVENQPLNALRFRANIWIAGAPAFDEENWKRYRVVPKKGDSVAPTLSVVCRTSRCTLPNVDPDTGTVDADIPPPDKERGRPQPSTTLIKHRTVEDGNPRALGYLGMHCVPEDKSLQAEQSGLYVQVGDEIEVLERGIHLFGSTADAY